MSEEKVLKEKVILEINFQQEAEHPAEWLDWELFSFSRRHGNFKDPDNFANRFLFAHRSITNKRSFFLPPHRTALPLIAQK